MKLVTLFTFAVIVFVLGLFVGTTFFHMHDASGRTVRPWEGITQTAPITPNTVVKQQQAIPSPPLPHVPRSLPQVPTPRSNARSWPSMDTLAMASGPLPIKVAPFTGAVIRPSSIK